MSSNPHHTADLLERPRYIFPQSLIDQDWICYGDKFVLAIRAVSIHAECVEIGGLL